MTREEALRRAKRVYLGWLSDEYDAGAVLVDNGEPTPEARLIERIADAIMGVEA